MTLGELAKQCEDAYTTDEDGQMILTMPEDKAATLLAVSAEALRQAEKSLIGIAVQVSSVYIGEEY